MTAEWENKLSQIEHEQYTSEQFMQEISQMITDLTNHYEIVEGADALMKRSNVIGACPHCGSEVVSKDIGWACRNRKAHDRVHGSQALAGKAGSAERLQKPPNRKGIHSGCPYGH